MGFYEVLGLQVTRSEKTLVEGHMPITSDLYQPYGFVHGGATISLLESVASIGAANNTDLQTHRPFGIDVHVRHRKSGQHGLMHARAELAEETVDHSGRVQHWKVAAYDDEGDVVSDGVVVTKIVSLEYLEQKRRRREAAAKAPVDAGSA